MNHSGHVSDPLDHNYLLLRGFRVAGFIVGAGDGQVRASEELGPDRVDLGGEGGARVGVQLMRSAVS